MLALSREFNQVVLALAPTFEARPIAPQSLYDLHQCDKMVVWDGDSARTIYGDPRVNHAARAWHDVAHLAGGFAFDLAGENAAAQYQIQQVLGRWPSAPRLWLRLIEIEVIEQAHYLAETGCFVADQLGFTTSRIRDL